MGSVTLELHVGTGTWAAKAARQRAVRQQIGQQARQESLAIARAQRGQSIDPAWRAKGRDAFRRGPSRPGRNRTCNPRFWSALLATPALQHLLIFRDLALGQQRWRRWTTPALALILALPNSPLGPARHARERVPLARRLIRRILRMCRGPRGLGLALPGGSPAGSATTRARLLRSAGRARIVRLATAVRGTWLGPLVRRRLKTSSVP